MKYRGALCGLAITVLAVVLLGGCDSDETSADGSASTSADPRPSVDDYRAVQDGRWQGVDWTIYRADGENWVCVEWTGTFEGDAPAAYPAELDLDRRSCIEHGVLSQAGGTLVQPMFTYRLPNGMVGVWGVTAASVERIDIQLGSGEGSLVATPVDGTFGVEFNDGATAGEVTVALSDGTTVPCTEPASLTELSWTCR